MVDKIRLVLQGFPWWTQNVNRLKRGREWKQGGQRNLLTGIEDQSQREQKFGEVKLPRMKGVRCEEEARMAGGVSAL